MSNVTNEELLDKVNNPLTRARRWARWAMYISPLLVAMIVGMLLNALIGGWWTQRKLDRQNMDALVLIVQYNMQQGKLALPPQLMPAPPAPAVAPKPAEAPPTK